MEGTWSRVCNDVIAIPSAVLIAVALASSVMTVAQRPAADWQPSKHTAGCYRLLVHTLRRLAQIGCPPQPCVAARARAAFCCGQHQKNTEWKSGSWTSAI